MAISGKRPPEASARPRPAPMGPPTTGPGAAAFLLAQVGALAAMRFAERLAPLGITPAHAGLLRAVAAEPGRSQQAVAAQLGILPSRLVALTDELESDGLIERRRNAVDRRHHALHLTPAGEQRLRELTAVAHEHAAELLAPLSEADRAALAKLLERLASAHGLTPGVHPGYRALGRSAPPGS